MGRQVKQRRVAKWNQKKMDGQLNDEDEVRMATTLAN